MNVIRKSSPDKGNNHMSQDHMDLSTKKNPQVVSERKVVKKKVNTSLDRKDLKKIDNDQLCIEEEDIKRTINIFLISIENLVNRNKGKYKDISFDKYVESIIKMILNSKKELKESTIKKVTYSVLGKYETNLPSLLDCLQEEAEYKLIQFRRTQEEQRAIEKSAIKAKYLAEHLDIPVNNLKYMKHLFYDLTRQGIATRYNTFSKTLAAQSENIDKEGVLIRETELKKTEIDSKIKKILKEESDIMQYTGIEYPFYIKNMFQKYQQIFERKPKISFHDLFGDKKILPYTLTVRVEVPIKNTNLDDNTPKFKVEYKRVPVKIKLRESVKIKFMNKSTTLDRRVLNDFIKNNIETSDLFWMLHIAIDKVIQQEQNKIKQEQREKGEEKKKK